MMDASVALMNQYAMISAQFPPIQTTSASTNTTVSSSSSTSTSVENTQKSETVEDPKASIQEKVATIVSNIANDEAGPSTSQDGNSSIETVEIDGNIITIEDIGRNDPSDSNDSISEVRRRRLQRFESKNLDS